MAPQQRCGFADQPPDMNDPAGASFKRGNDYKSTQI
jgi:hypothetical protein